MKIKVKTKFFCFVFVQGGEGYIEQYLLELFSRRINPDSTSLSVVVNRSGLIVKLVCRPFTFSFQAASISYEPLFRILTGYTCKAPDGHIVKLGETYHMTSYTYCHCESRHFGSNLAVCVNKAIDPIHHIDPNNPYYYVTSYVDPPQKAPVVDPQNAYYNTGG